MGMRSYTIFWEENINSDKIIDIFKRLHHNEKTTNLACWLGYITFNEKEIKTLSKYGINIFPDTKYLHIEQYDQKICDINNIFGYEDWLEFYDFETGQYKKEKIYNLKYSSNEIALFNKLGCFDLMDILDDEIDELFERMEEIELRTLEEIKNDAKKEIVDISKKIEILKAYKVLECISLEDRTDIEQYILELKKENSSKKITFYIKYKNNNIVTIYECCGRIKNFKEHNKYSIFDKDIMLSRSIKYLEERNIVLKEMVKEE